MVYHQWSFLLTKWHEENELKYDPLSSCHQWIKKEGGSISLDTIRMDDWLHLNQMLSNLEKKRINQAYPKYRAHFSLPFRYYSFINQIWPAMLQLPTLSSISLYYSLFTFPFSNDFKAYNWRINKQSKASCIGLELISTYGKTPYPSLNYFLDKYID